MSVPYIEIAVGTPDEDTQDVLVALLGAQGFDAFTQEPHRLLAYVPADAFDAAALAEALTTVGLDPALATQTEMPDVNYNAQWEADYPSVPVSDAFLIYPSFRPPTDAERAHYRTCLEVQPEMSFGTGHHATTRMVLLLMDELLEFPSPPAPLPQGGEGSIGLTPPSPACGRGGQGGEGLRVLDFGAGTGVLAIAALLRGAQWADLVDNNEWAVRNAHTNLARNHVQHRAAVYEGGLEAVPPTPHNTPYDLVLANIDRYVLLQHGPQLRQKLRPGGTLIVSGILEVDAEPIITYFQRFDFNYRPEHRRTEAGWLALRFTAH